MSGTQRLYYLEENDSLQGYDILKRDGVINPDGTRSPEKVCTIYSMEYLKPILATLNNVDSLEEGEEILTASPIIEG